jgi:type I pantothenate kinase
MSALDDVCRLIDARRSGGNGSGVEGSGAGRRLIGVTGAVAVGKSTFARELAAAFASQPAAPSVEVIATDGFLFPNAVLESRGLLNRKGFPETYDDEALRGTLAALRGGPTQIPAYSHVIYDVDPLLARRLEPPDVLIVEGLGLQRGAPSLGLDALVYLDADEAHIETWFEARFIDLWRAAETDPTSFYARFRHMDEAGTRALAGQVWRMINLPNLREHIVLGRALADIVVRKGADHAIMSVDGRG